MCTRIVQVLNSSIILPKSAITLPNNNWTHMYNFPFISIYIYISIGILTNTIIFSDPIISHYIFSPIVSFTQRSDWHTLYFTHVLVLQSCILFVKYSTSFFNIKLYCILTKRKSQKEHIKSLCLCNKTETYASKSSWDSGISSLQDFRYLFFSFSPWRSQ